jgi:hypothetical protein
LFAIVNALYKPRFNVKKMCAVHAATNCVYKVSAVLYREGPELHLGFSTQNRPLLHPDVSTHWAGAAPISVYTSEACAAPGSVWSIGT